MATMKDVAEKACVSQATVSRVLNGSTGVSRDKRSRVMEWARKLDFEPNRSARSLAANRSHLLGVILPDLMNPYFAEILAHIEKVASRNGYNVILANTEGDPVREKAEYASLKARQVDGLLVVPAPGTQILEDMRRQAVKSVVATLEIPGIDCVGVSHYRGGELAAKHFLETGVERFAFLGSTADDKFRGYRDTLVAAGLAEDKLDIIMNEHWWVSNVKRGYESAEDFLETHRARSRLGVFSGNDPYALGVVHAAQDLDMPIPEEVAVIGFDDTFICESVRPTLTSIYQPIEEIGRLAVELLLARIEGGPIEMDEQHIVLEPKLIRRETS